MGEVIRDAWVFHAGALGDSVLVWPLLRAMGRAGWRVWFATDLAKARLASRRLLAGMPLVPLDGQRREFTRLWSGDGGAAPHPSVSLVVNFVADPATPAGEQWGAGANTMFPQAELLHVGPPGSISRAKAWNRFDVSRLGGVAPGGSREGPVICHVGAGSEAKRWKLDAWEELVRAVPRCVLVGGEVESERFTPEERRGFDALGGRLCGSLDELAEMIAGASAFVGCDTGPTHLAAQLGVPTLALFGPTDPAVWRPVGPGVRVVAPAQLAAMSWLAPEVVIDELRRIPG